MQLTFIAWSRYTPVQMKASTVCWAQGEMLGRTRRLISIFNLQKNSFQSCHMIMTFLSGSRVCTVFRALLI